MEAASCELSLSEKQAQELEYAALDALHRSFRWKYIQHGFEGYLKKPSWIPTTMDISVAIRKDISKVLKTVTRHPKSIQSWMHC